MPKDSRNTVTNAANAVAEALDARVYLYNGRINRAGFLTLGSSLQGSEGQPARSNSVLILRTIGGDANYAYRIARTMQMTSEKFVLCIPHLCKSAGTLIALGAHQLMVMALAELGPLDVQLDQRDEIGEVRSGMVVRTALKGLREETYSVFEHVMLGIKAGSEQTVSFEVSSRIATSVASGVMSAIYAQINPELLGNDLRDLSVATAYGTRLARHGNNVLPGTIQKLVEGYPAHDFIIDRDETATLFETVESPSEEVNALIRCLGKEVYQPQSPQLVKRLDRSTEEPAKKDEDEAAGVPAGEEKDANGAQASEGVQERQASEPKKHEAGS